MRCLSRSILALTLLAMPASAAEPGPLRAAEFLDSIGVNIHMPYTDTAYTDVERVRRSLDYCGIRHVRNLLQSRPGDPAGLIHLSRLAASRVSRFNFFSTEPDLERATGWLTDFATRFPGSIEAVEGPNEVDHWPISFKGGSGREAAVAYQRELYAAVHAAPALSGVVVYGLTGLGGSWSGDLSAIMDAANEHPYARNGAPPSAHLLKEIEQTHRQVAPSRPMVVTETGYPTLLNRPEISFGKDGVSEPVQARYVLDLLFDFRAAGVMRTYLYELLDEKPDPDGRMIEQHYGLFGVTGAPKEAAHALHNLATILKDEGPEAERFAPAPLAVDIAGLPASGNSLTLAKSDGTRQVVVWAEPRIWDAASSTAIAPPEAKVTLRFDRSHGTVKVFDPIAGAAPIDEKQNVPSITVVVTDHPVIVEVTPDRP